MIFVNYADIIYGNQVYCAVDIMMKDVDIYKHLLIVRWFGAYSGVLGPARGEMIALAAINHKLRNNTILISPQSNAKPDEYLMGWRSKYKLLKYAPIDIAHYSLLESEVTLIHELKEISITSKIMAKNLPTIMLTEDDKNISLLLGNDVDDLPYDKIVLCLVKQSEFNKLEIIGFRKPSNNKHLHEIIKQSNEHNLLLYYSSYVVSNQEIIAEGPWILLPASYRNFVPNKYIEQPAEPIEEKPMQLVNNFVNDEISPFINQIQNTEELQEIVQDSGGYSCPFCNKKVKSVFGLTNHVNGKHPDKKEEYERAYKN